MRATPVNGQECVFVYARMTHEVSPPLCVEEKHTPESLVKYAILHLFSVHAEGLTHVRGGLKRVYETMQRMDRGANMSRYSLEWSAEEVPPKSSVRAALWVQGNDWFLCTRSTDDTSAWVLASTAFPLSCTLRMHVDWNQPMFGLFPLLPASKRWNLKLRETRQPVNIVGHECILFHDSTPPP